MEILVLFKISVTKLKAEFSEICGSNDQFSYIFTSYSFHTEMCCARSQLSRLRFKWKLEGKFVVFYTKKGQICIFRRSLVGLHFQLSASGTRSTFDGFRFNWKTFGAKNSIPPPIVRLPSEPITMYRENLVNFSSYNENISESGAKPLLRFSIINSETFALSSILILNSIERFLRSIASINCLCRGAATEGDSFVFLYRVHIFSLSILKYTDLNVSMCVRYIGNIFKIGF